ncbi:FAD-dependent monooxygenase [Amycolatopsis sp. PS_44_ISF1]|uniref:FAD-dependent oxidoreductase n=1 Tax=Amycolatopsis sp. PS_44_ISF1 TaxID=2974917 RepID=UPI0028DE7EB8|nr:FAD-dependent monooxygenase [Amycolatopsis sp. PS_44_ISF1]MDT8911577.1 FAD-dependent monooxygenase [Amycolatopsis sp. PS_44_ISF1]
MKVLVIGAGLGGLALARRLVRAGIEVGVRERDSAVETRFQGYRIGLGPDAERALRGCLPERLSPLLDAIGGDLAGPGRAVDTRLTLLGEVPRQDEGTLFDRHVLRHLLLAGMGEHIAFGRKLDGYEELPDGRVRVRYGDGSEELADVVVGADGMGSTVRRRLVPSVRVRVMDRVGAIGRTPLTPRFAGLVPGWSTVVNAPRQQLFLGKMPFRRPPAEAAAELAPDVVLPGTRSYLRWVMMIPAEFAGNVAELEADPVAALAVLRGLVEDWHPDLRALFEDADLANSGIAALRAGDPVRPWPTRPVTLLGDAAHPAPPGGLGANLAFLDAELLGRKLTEVRDGADLLTALAAYEARMCGYAAEALGYAKETFKSFDELRRNAPAV